MATDQNKIQKDLRQWFEAFNARDWDRLDRLSDEIYAADYTLHDPGSPNPGRGPSMVKQFARGIVQQSPDVRMTPEDVFGEGDRLACRLTGSSTNASTGKRVSTSVLWISRYVGNQCMEDWELVGQPTEVPA
jgi:predicted ester cyclase